MGKDSVTKEEIEKVYEIYGMGDFFNEYLVDGAIITCDQSTKGLKRVKRNGRGLNFSVTDNGINAGKVQVDADKILGKLVVTNLEKAKAGGKKYATTIDNDYDDNIPCFGNCNNEQYNDDEKKRLMEKGVKDNKHGTCKYLISITSEWEDDDLLKAPQKFDTSTGMKDGLTMTNSLFCAHGGWIYPVTSGQSDYNEDEAKKDAISIMSKYLDGFCTEEEVEKAVQFLGWVLPEIAQVKEKKIGEAEDAWEKEWKKYWKDDKFDPYIKAWTYYWNETKFPNKDMEIRPEVVKAMIMVESGWGTGTTQNSGRDVMQALYPGDYALWLLSGYNPTQKGMSHAGKTEPAVVWAKDGMDCNAASMRVQDYVYMYSGEESDPSKGITMTEHIGFKNGLGILRDNVITVITSDDSAKIKKLKGSEGEYLIHYDRVTPNMSIACGVGYLAFNMEDGGSEEEGVRQYNNGGKESKTGIKDAYVKDVNEHLDYLILNDGKSVQGLQK